MKHTEVRTIPVERSPAKHPCAHCGLDTPPGLVEPGADTQFCCSGCRAAFSIIHACGLERYYHLRDVALSSAEGPDLRTRKSTRFDEFDDPAFTALFTRERPALDGRPLREVELTLEGVHCAACVWLIERLPRLATGVIEARLEFRRSVATIVWDPALIPLSAIARTLDAVGYRPHRTSDGSARRVRRQDDRRALVRIGVAGACAGNVMLLASALYAGMFDAMEPAYHIMFRWLSMAISIIAVAWPGSVFFRGAWASLRTRRPSLDVPIAVALGVGAAWGAINTIRGAGEIYFDSLSVLVFALLVGRWIQRRQQRWAADGLELLYSLRPTSARIVGDDGPREVAIESVAVNDIVEVICGESVPIDGEVIEGESQVDQSLLTGEPRPVRVGPGDNVTGGSVNVRDRLLIRATATGDDTRVARLMRFVEETSSRRAPIVRLADRLAGGFVIAMLVLAAITAVAWLVMDPSRAADNAVALLVVACPCALGLATPLAVSVAIGRAARESMLIKGGDVMQSLAERGTIYLDKTGTLTLGEFGVVAWHGSDGIKPLVAALEARSSHPIARAIVKATAGDVTLRADSAVETPGGGIDGWVSDSRITVGSPAFVESTCGPFPPELASHIHAITRDGHTPVAISLDARPVGVIALGDTIRDDAALAITRLREMGWRIRVLSGDHPDVVRAVASRLGIRDDEALGGVAPERKAETIARHAAQGDTVIMVGDGVNDAAALAAATVGVAVHGGAEASLAAADVYIGRPGLMRIVDLIEGARRTMRAIKINMAVSITYNAVAVSLAMVGVLNPLIAAVLMPMSSLSVVALSVRSRTFRRGA